MIRNRFFYRLVYFNHCCCHLVGLVSVLPRRLTFFRRFMFKLHSNYLSADRPLEIYYLRSPVTDINFDTHLSTYRAL